MLGYLSPIDRRGLESDILLSVLNIVERNSWYSSSEAPALGFNGYCLLSRTFQARKEILKVVVIQGISVRCIDGAERKKGHADIAFLGDFTTSVSK